LIGKEPRVSESQTRIERRNLVLDALADVLITCFFLTSELVVEVYKRNVGDLSTLGDVTLTSFQVGSAVAAISHVVKIVWQRSFIGPLCQAVARLVARLWRRRRKPPNQDDEDSHGDLPRPPAAKDEEQARPAVLKPGPANFGLLHPEPGHAIARAQHSAELGLVGGFLTACYLVGEMLTTQQQIYLAIAGVVVLAGALAVRELRDRHRDGSPNRPGALLFEAAGAILHSAYTTGLDALATARHGPSPAPTMSASSSPFGPLLITLLVVGAVLYGIWELLTP